MKNKCVMLFDPYVYTVYKNVFFLLTAPKQLMHDMSFPRE